MISKTLKVTGVLALFLWTVGGLVAWFLVQERVHIVVTEAASDPDRGPSEIAVLREDLAQMHKDLEALATALQAGLIATGQGHDNTTLAATPGAEPAGGRGFLAFRLPDHGFQFDKLQRFEIIPSLSRVGFDGKSTLHNFSGVTSDVHGRVTACLAHPDVDCSAWGEVDAGSLRTGHDGRDQEMFEHLKTKEHHKITFEIRDFEPTNVDGKAMVVEGTATGQMTIRGVTRSEQMAVKLSLDSSRRLLIEGESKIKLTDYKVPIPSALGLVRMYDEVKIWIAVRARCLGVVKKTPDAGGSGNGAGNGAGTGSGNGAPKDLIKEARHEAR